MGFLAWFTALLLGLVIWANGQLLAEKTVAERTAWVEHADRIELEKKLAICRVRHL